MRQAQPTDKDIAGYGFFLETAPNRLELPAAGRASARSRFAPDGVAAKALRPEEALALLDARLRAGTTVETVSISGPGDPLATPETTLATLKGVRGRLPRVQLLLSTMALEGEALADALAGLAPLGVAVRADAAEASVAAELHAWIRPGLRTMPLVEAAAFLVTAQARSAAAFVQAGLPVAVRLRLTPGLNEDQVGPVAEMMAKQGAGLMLLSLFRPTGSDRRLPETAGAMILERARSIASRFLPTVLESGLADEPRLSGSASPLPSIGLAGPEPGRPYAAVCSLGGLEVDQHLGHAHRYLIYEKKDGAIRLLETRNAPEPGSGSARWEEAADTLSDCFVLVAQSAGESPRRILGARGVRVALADGRIEDVMDAVFDGAPCGLRPSRGSSSRL